MPRSTAALLAGLQIKTAKTSPPMEMLSSIWEYLSCLVRVPTLSAASISAIKTRIKVLTEEESSPADLVACDGVGYLKSGDDSQIFAVKEGCDSLRSLGGSVFNVQLAGIEPGSGVLYTFRWNPGKRAMELHRDTALGVGQSSGVSCWSAEGLLQSKPLFAVSEGSLFVANCITKGPDVLSSIDIRPSGRQGEDGEWFKIFAPRPSELIGAMSVHACKDTSRLLCAMQHSIWTTDLSPHNLRHGTEVVWTCLIDLPEFHRVHQLIGLTENVVIGLVSYSEDASSPARAVVTIDLVNGELREVVRIEEESVRVFLTRDRVWMASTSEESGAPRVETVDLEWTLDNVCSPLDVCRFSSDSMRLYLQAGDAAFPKN
ncbi:hypothetical protein FOZ62_027591 [Perkinsus olseni]|uniref:Uncharacterized protein n=1 Tax=Perkinsus olseni TaxID=32597 RepID=A0A7J6R186_PEROL|nr:hypothetical protein FOZ62_027591 [Perkinsus olseni]